MGPAACAGQGNVRGVTCQLHHIPRSDLRAEEGASRVFFKAGTIIPGIFWEGEGLVSPQR